MERDDFIGLSEFIAEQKSADSKAWSELQAQVYLYRPDSQGFFKTFFV